MPLDIALSYDAASRRCDLVFTGTDFALDSSYVTPVLMSLANDRRAHADDDLPDTAAVVGDAPPFTNPRRGWAGDALDVRNERTGSRLWVLARAKQTETTRRLAQAIDAEALGWLSDRLGLDVTIAVEWVRRNVLGHQIKIAGQAIRYNQVVGL